MSLLKSIRQQLGLSSTATQNFTLTAEAADGTLKLARGNAGATTQDILTVDAAGKVNFPQGNSVNQDYINVTGSRVLGTTYTNNTTSPILVCVSFTSNGAGGFGTSVTINGTSGMFPSSFHAANAGYAGSQQFWIPVGATYSVAALNNATLTAWRELR